MRSSKKVKSHRHGKTWPQTTGKRIRVIIEALGFNKNEVLNLFGVWREKSTEEIKIFSDILKERDYFKRIDGLKIENCMKA